MTQQSNPAQPNDVTVTAIPAFTDNYIWLLQDNATNQNWLVDPGDSQPVKAYFNSHQIQTLSGILVTHHHYDHIDGIPDLLELFPHTPVYGIQSQRVPTITQAVTGGQTLKLSPNLTLQIIDVPGHTKDHIAFYRDAPSAPLLFCGDTLFAAGCGRLFEGSPSQMRQSLDQLRQLPRQTQVYCAHEYTLSNLAFALAVEPDNERLRVRLNRIEALRQRGIPSIPTQLQDEIETNPFLRWDCDPVIAMADLRGANSSDSDDVFAKIRAWKDTF